MTDTAKPNIPLLRKVVEWVEEQDALPVGQREWRQDWWRTPNAECDCEASVLGYCGTLYCVAGKVCEDAGYQWVGETTVLTPQGRMHAQDAAKRLLGLPQRHGLFASDLTAADVRRIAEGIAGERL